MTVPHSRLIGVFALFLAAAGHAGMAQLSVPDKAEISGGNTGLAAQGFSFADLVQGVDTPIDAKELPDADIATAPAATTLSPQVEKVVVEAVQSAVQPPPTGAVPILPALEVEPSPSQKPAEPRPAETATAAPKPEVLEPLPDAKPEPKPRPNPKRVQRHGNNAEQNTLAGMASGTAPKHSGQARTSPGTAKQQGNAAADNYRGKVLRRVMRAKRQRVNIRGAVLVRFTITGSGALASARIAKSSGSSKLDNIALAQVHRAAPFPPPPKGVRPSYTVRIKGK
ncbi:energy transducer TonB family protein [Phaeobacter piscinae]|uniref:energy transducer TonB family protein n=1 Tax=Phaeobacter piscinae TaxID=1580596 RepID=UPI000C9C4C74|nr:energy transducer TonB [Phaeobacter piscinae]AUQ76033.1 outer membrane transport energization protein TonB [Phaeobacter piscinae]